MTFSGQIAWITGASSGIGEALAKGLDARGAKLILSGRNSAELERVASACADVLVLPFETTDYSALSAIVEEAWGWRGAIDLVINNAGISQRSLAEETAFEVYERIVAVDLLAPIALTQALLPRMIARKSGRLAFVSSIAGKVGVPMRTAYCAAKAGILGYADAVRTEVGVHGIAVHGIVPGSIRTNVSRNALTGDGSARGFSDKAIDNGIAPDEAAVTMLDGMAAGMREIIVAVGPELALAEARRTPEAILDQMGGLMAKGYDQRLKQG